MAQPRTIPAGFVEVAPGEYAKQSKPKLASQINQEQCGAVQIINDVSGIPAAIVTHAVNIEFSPSHDEAKLNKLETAYLSWLQTTLKPQWIGVQCLTLKIGHDCRYTPDFITIEGGKLVARETKGFFRDDAKVKIKVAARMYRWIEFIVARKAKGQWEHEPVKP